jgi:hypothetical protein
MQEKRSYIAGEAHTIRGAFDHGLPITVRRASAAADWLALGDLAALDSADPLEGNVILAEVDGALWAAQSLSDGRTISDPFRPCGEARELLALRAEHLVRASRTVTVGWRRPVARLVRRA